MEFRRRQKNKENKLQDSKTCPECFAAIDKKYLICPCCGFEFELNKVEIDTTFDLKEIKRKWF